MQDSAHDRHQAEAAGAGVAPSLPASRLKLLPAPAANPSPADVFDAALLPRAAGGGAGAVAAIVRAPPQPQREEPDAAPADAPIPREPANEVAPTPLPLPPAPVVPALSVHDEPAPALTAPAPLAVPVFLPEPAPEAPPAPPPPVFLREPAPPHEPAPRAPFVRSEPHPLPRLDTPPDPTVPALDRSPWPLIARAVRLALLAAGSLALLFIVVVLGLIVLYRWVDPPTSTLMLFQQLTGTPVHQRWVPLSRISPTLQHAAIMSEDAKFCRHGGVDWGELAVALDNARDGVPRGGSTISMQVVKNLFLWQSKSYLRKAIEIPLTFAIEGVWSKPRILEIYLNIAEWGPGIFGAEAAARYHFRKPAAALTPREAALLAVSLPNPFDRRAGNPGPGTLRLADHLGLRMRAAPGASFCVRRKVGR